MIRSIKYHKTRNEFLLADGHRHYKIYKTRRESVLSIDNWLMNSDNKLKITFLDDNGKLHKDVPVDTSSMVTYFDGNDNYGDWRTFVWDFPTELGHIYMYGMNSKCYFNRKEIRNSSVVVSI